MILNQILKLCESQGFLLKAKQLDNYIVGPMGTLLLQNLKNEWLNAFINNKHYSIFYCNHDFVDNFQYVRTLCQNQLPFGIAECLKDKMENQSDLGACIGDLGGLRCTVFVAPDNPTHSLHQWQRLRRMWWRKFASTPSRYFTTDIIEDTPESQRIDICAKHSFGDYVVESVKLLKSHPLLNSEDLNNKSERKNVESICLTSDIDLNTMYMNSLLDAYELLKHQNGDRQVFKFHRKLAPYKVAFSIPKTSGQNTLRDLQDLASYLSNKLKAINITPLLFANSNRETLERQFKTYDELGIPYTVLLNENTLKDGVLSLRSRDTTIKEQVHVTEIQNYIEMLFKNY